MNGSGHSRRALDWAIRGASKHQLPLTVMPIHPLRVRPVTGIYRGLRNYPENTYDRTTHAGRFSISGARH